MRVILKFEMLFLPFLKSKAGYLKLLSNMDLFYFLGFKCPVCSKFVPSDEMDLHLVMCLTKPRITYNGKSSALK